MITRHRLLLNLSVLLLFLQVSPVSVADRNLENLQIEGKYIGLGLHRLYVDCRGSQEPTVLVDVGLGDASINWLPVMNGIKEEARICLYDRAGYGWSDNGPGARTTAQITYELHAMLEMGRIPGPYIVVGHSFGGFTARYFATVYPAETVGAVLVDSSHPEQVIRLADLDKQEAKRELIVSRLSLPPKDLTPLQRKWYFLNSSRKATFTLMDELKHFTESARQVENAGEFPDIPLAVMTRGKPLLPTINGKSLEAEWVHMQNDLVTLSPQAWHVVVENSGHNIYADNPRAIIQEIKKVIKLARMNIQEEYVTGAID